MWTRVFNCAKNKRKRPGKKTQQLHTIFVEDPTNTSRLAQNSEIVAMLSGGMPFKRLFRPYVYASLLLVSLAMVLGHWVVPRANEQKLAFEESFVNTSVHVKDRNLYREVAPGTIV